MELVGGMPVTDFCDTHRLPTRDRLELFIQICHAIQHAHQKGIIHRDIKPSNILVADGTPNSEPHIPACKVIDFGIANFLADAQCCQESAATVGARPGWDTMDAVTGGRVVEVDADIASRWGPRTADFIESIATAINGVTGT